LKTIVSIRIIRFWEGLRERRVSLLGSVLIAWLASAVALFCCVPLGIKKCLFGLREGLAEQLRPCLLGEVVGALQLAPGVGAGPPDRLMRFHRAGSLFAPHRLMDTPSLDELMRRAEAAQAVGRRVLDEIAAAVQQSRRLQEESERLHWVVVWIPTAEPPGRP
jgi:hypothetical protein